MMKWKNKYPTLYKYYEDEGILWLLNFTEDFTRYISTYVCINISTKTSIDLFTNDFINIYLYYM